jgi:hypothetical protein
MSKNNVKKVSLQFELLNTYYQNSACNLSYTPKITVKENLMTKSTGGYKDLSHTKLIIAINYL